jgi:hypothetical protein
VNYDCNERLVVRLHPGGSHREASYVSHPWRVRAVSGALIRDLGATPAGTGDYALSVP